jgi:hypothetical protein
LNEEYEEYGEYGEYGERKSESESREVKLFGNGNTGEEVAGKSHGIFERGENADTVRLRRSSFEKFDD